MKITKRKILNFLVLFAVFFAMARLSLAINIVAASADSLWDTQVGLEDEIGYEAFRQTGEPNDVRVIVAGVIKAFLGILGITFLILIIMAGFKWMTSGGNEEKLKEARAQILRASIGLAIILTAWIITTFITNCLVDITGAAAFKWYCP
jgi:hypothetical protein